MSPVRIIKFLGAWGCIAAATALLIFTSATAFGLPGVLSLLAIAFANAPEGL